MILEGEAAVLRTYGIRLNVPWNRGLLEEPGEKDDKDRAHPVVNTAMCLGRRNLEDAPCSQEP